MEINQLSYHMDFGIPFQAVKCSLDISRFFRVRRAISMAPFLGTSFMLHLPGSNENKATEPVQTAPTFAYDRI